MQSLTQWERFANKVQSLNRHSPGHTRYKSLFMGRHGEGFHNRAQAFYGTRAWDVRAQTAHELHVERDGLLLSNSGARLMGEFEYFP